MHISFHFSIASAALSRLPQKRSGVNRVLNTGCRFLCKLFIIILIITTIINVHNEPKFRHSFWKLKNFTLYDVDQKFATILPLNAYLQVIHPVDVLLGILSGNLFCLTACCAKHKRLKMHCVRVVIFHCVIIFRVFMLAVSHYMHFL